MAGFDDYKMYVDGRFRESVSGKTYDVLNTFTGESLCKVSDCCEDDMIGAIRSAGAARKKVREMPLVDKIQLFRDAAGLIRKRKDIFIDLLVRNAGQVKKYASRGIEKAPDILEHLPMQIKHLHSEVIRSRYGSKFGYTLHEPLGVVGIIVPINAPLLLPLTALSSSFLAGNCSILKPAYQTPLPALELGKILHECGAPPGAFNMVPGEGRRVGTTMVGSPGVDGIVFFGSTKIGSAIGGECARNIKKCVLNLAGKNPLIVLADADIGKAVDVAVQDAYVNSGQVCMSIEAMYVHEDVFEEFSERLVEKTRLLKVGDPFDEATDVGPIPVQKVVDHAKMQLDDAVSKGAQVLTGGRINGNLIEPTVLGNVSPDMKIVLERTSAPIAPLVKIRNVDEAVRFANKSLHSLRGAVFTKNIHDAFKVVHNLDVGNVVVNGNTFYVEEHMPHGGTNLAGMDGARYLIDELTRRKFVMFHDHIV
ncbi:aldehyde dehydrogenase [Candidatus Woesearchaeota archaeon]|nr:aldehyde dehydrogenase [Candidatus Woesearchaeota archaeon]